MTGKNIKFPDFKVKYHEDRLREFGVEPSHRNIPIEVDADFGIVRSTILKALERNHS